MHRRAFLKTLSGSLLAAPLAAVAQPRGTKLYYVGIPTSDPPQDARVVEFRDGLRALGYIEGQNLVVNYRSADGHLDRLPPLAAELVASNVDVIVTLGPAIWAVKQQTSSVPIVIAFSGDTVATGVVSNLARPGETSP